MLALHSAVLLSFGVEATFFSHLGVERDLNRGQTRQCPPAADMRAYLGGCEGREKSGSSALLPQPFDLQTKRRILP